MLFLHGSETQGANWYVTEKAPTVYCRIYYLHSGQVFYRDAHTLKQLKSDHLYVFPSTLPYEMSHDPKDPINCLFLHVDIAPYLLSTLLELSVHQDLFLQHLLETMDTYIHNQPKQEIDSIMESLATALVSYLISKGHLQASPGKIADTIMYISDHLGEKITVELLSELCGYHKQYYIRLFSAHLGATPHQYLISYRMKRAFSMLLEGKSVSETADTVGYPELRNFIRAFKKYYGYSPSQVKKYIHYTN
jgi:AraC-like DNA-binding protein